MKHYTPIWRYIRANLPLLDKAVIDQLRVMFTETNVYVCHRERSRWVIQDDNLATLDAFLADKSNIRVAEAQVKGLKLGAAGARRRESSPSFPMTVSGDPISFGTLHEVETFVNSVVSANEEKSALIAGLQELIARLQEQIAELEERLARIAKPVLVATTETMPVAAEPEKNDDVLVPPSQVEKRLRTMERKRNEGLEAVAQMIAANPDVYLGTRSKWDLLIRVCALVNSGGLRTYTGRCWTPQNMNFHVDWLRLRVREIAEENNKKFGKPRVRVKTRAA